jgi:hypothetical protein
MAVGSFEIVPAQTEEAVNVILRSRPGLGPLTEVECRV